MCVNVYVYGDVKRVREVSQVLTALQFVAFLPVGGGGHTDVHYVVAWRFIVCRSVSYLFL